MTTPLWEDLTEQEQRALLFTPCGSKKALHRWIRRFLELDLPDGHIDPTSNSSPMELIWEVYDSARRNDENEWSRLLAYAARESIKTLAAAILEVLNVVHLGRSIVHGAAIKAQSQKAQGYVTDFFNKPLLREYVTLNNDSGKEIIRYVHRETGEILTPGEYKQLKKNASAKDLAPYKELKYGIVIVVATMQSMNSQHAPFVVLDELDVLANPRVYKEAKMIPSPFEGKLPKTFLTSSRKFRFGLVQEEVDNAARTGMQVRHWNIIDVTERCPDKRHRPDLPRQDIYVNAESLEAVDADAYKGFSAERKEKFVLDAADPQTPAGAAPPTVHPHAGCLKNCRMYAMCRGRLAFQKKSDPEAKVKSMLKPISHVQEQFNHVDVETAKAQLLSWKPGTTGIIYPYFESEVHYITATQIANMVTGIEHPIGMTKGHLLQLLKSRTTVRFRGGMDFGFTHHWSVTVAAIDGPRAFVLDCISVAELETAQQIEMAKGRIGHYPGLKIHADPEDPQSIRSFRKAGFRIAAVKKGPGSVVGGINTVRTMLRPATGKPTLYFLRDDDPDGGLPILQRSLQIYHWKLDAAGNPTDEPADEGADENDALRYLIRGCFGKGGKVTAAKETLMPIAMVVPQQAQVYRQESWMSQVIAEKVGGGGSTSVAPGAGERRGSVYFEIE